MITQVKPNYSNARLRITAMWAFSEAFLGGILHALHLPFAGLILSSFAVLCMVGLSLHDHQRGQILKATLLVIILKAILSPHTPISAYFAVFLQGLFGELFFLFSGQFFLSCFLLGIAALMQSAFQKLIVLTLLFGVDFWKAMNEFLNGINKTMGVTDINYSFYIISIYMGLHFVAGVFVGILSSRLPNYLNQSMNELAERPTFDSVIPEVKQGAKHKRSKLKSPLFWIVFALAVVALYTAYQDASINTLIHNKALKLLIRSLLLLTVWYFFLAPILILVFQKWLSKQSSKWSNEVQHILRLIPEMRSIAKFSWEQSAKFRGIKRLKKFMHYAFYLIIQEDADSFAERGHS